MAIIVISGSCVVTGVSCDFFEPCICVVVVSVVGCFGAVGVVGPGVIAIGEIFIP